MLAPNLNTPIHLAGDMDRGFSTTYDLRTGAIGQVILVYTGRYAHPYAEREVRCEVYEMNGLLSVHTCCVRCGDAAWISGDKKRIEYDRQRNQIFIERFVCTGELEKDGAKREFGINRCNAALVYEGRTIRDAA